MDNIKITRSGRNNQAAISWFEDPKWPQIRKDAERKYHEMLLKRKVDHE